MSEIEHRRRTGHLIESHCVASGRGVQVRPLYWHGKDLLGSQRRVLEQAFTQVTEISIWVSGWRYALVNLHHAHAFPRYLFVCQGTQHFPRGMTTANGHNEAATLRHSRAGFRGDNLGSLPRHCVRINKYLNLHGSSYTEVGYWSDGFRTQYSITPIFQLLIVGF